MSTKEIDPHPSGKHVLFYDGVCGLCDHAVRFVLREDKEKKFLFAPLQGETAKEFLSHLTPEERAEDTLYLLEGKDVHMLGQAGLRTLWLLGGVWSLPGSLYFITPACLADPVYRFIAKRRYKIFGKKECVIFPEEAKERFLP